MNRSQLGVNFRRRSRILIYFLICMIVILYVSVNAKASNTLSSISGNRDWKWPVPSSKNISSCFPNNCGHESIHHALDISGNYGSSIYASYDGTVLLAASPCDKNYGKSNGICTCGKGASCLGNYVYILHNYKGTQFVSRYGHMQKVNVKTGQNVTKNTIIGEVGSTGASTGPHLDFTIWQGSNVSKPSTTSNQWIDPFLNQFLEKVNNLTSIGCNDGYVNEVNQLYREQQPNEKPTNVEKALEKNTFFTNEHITYYCTGLYADYYVISIYNAQGNIVETVKVNPGEYCTRYYDPGDYMVYCEAYNYLGNTFSNTIKFTVKSLEKPTNVKIALEKNIFLTTDHVTYYCTGDNVSYFIISIYDDKGNVVETVKINPGEYCTRYYDIGEYTAYCEGYNSCGNTFSNTISFRVKSATEITEPHKHNYSSSIKKSATCTEPGIMLYTCKNNDDSYEKTIPATGHQHTELRNVKSATCGQEGYTGDTYCKDCNTKLSSGKSIAKKAHTWDAGKITQKATCIEKGVKTFTCTVCQTTKAEEIPATGHGTRITKFAKNASCKTEGYTGDIYCQDCGILLEEGEVIQKTEHAWNDGKVTQDAACTEKGVKTYTCTVCQATKTEEIPATGHGKTEVRNQKDATCKAEGYTGDSYCTVCNQKICAGKKIAKTAHSWDKGKITRQPTTAKTGIKTYTCTKCKTTRTETIAKLKVKKLAVGKIIKDKATNGVYKVLKGGLSVEFTKPITKKASVKIPDTIKVSGVTCKVTGISANAFKSNSLLKTISIGKNVTTIGNNAFYGCKKLNKITGGNGIAKIGEKAFANCGSLSSVTIAGSVRSIGKQAFYNCKKLKSIVVNTVALTDKNIGAKAFSGIYAKPTVKVPAKQLKAYQKLLRSKGMSSKAKYKK